MTYSLHRHADVKTRHLLVNLEKIGLGSGSIFNDDEKAISSVHISQGLRLLPPAPFSSSCLQFGRLGASILAPLGTISARWGRLGGPWEQQDGHVGVRDQMFSDFYTILVL